VPTVVKSGSLSLLEPSGPVMGLLYLFTSQYNILLHCATNRKVAGSIPDGVIGIFHFIRSHYGPGVDSASNINEYQEHFLGVKVAGA